LRLALILILAATTASAQTTTWHGLHFGQSRDDVRTQLADQNTPAETSPDGALQTNTDLALTLPGLLNPIPITANLHFDAATTLADVTLTLDLPAMHRDWASLGTDQALFAFATDQLTLSLAGIYGPPAYTSANCTATTEALTSACTILWRGNQQSIELERLPTHNGPRLRILYLPLATDL
jgi:hypothetical protein